MQSGRWLGLVLSLALWGCSGPHSLGFSESAWRALSQDERDQLLAQNMHHTHDGIRQFDHLPEGPFSEVVIGLSGGTAVLWPGEKRMAYDPIQAKLSLGECKDITLKNDRYAGVLCICYKGGTVMLDPSRENPTYSHGGLVLHQNALWRFGVLNPSVRSYGHILLKKARLAIQGAYDG